MIPSERMQELAGLVMRREPFVDRRQRAITADVTRHVVWCRHGRKVSMRERDDDDACLEPTIRGILSGEIEDVVSIVAFNPVEGWSRDVTEDVAIECANRVRLGDQISADLRAFIERNAGLEYMADIDASEAAE